MVPPRIPASEQTIITLTADIDSSGIDSSGTHWLGWVLVSICGIAYVCGFRYFYYYNTLLYNSS